MDLQLIDDVEFEDFNAPVRDAGLDPADFKISETVTGAETGLATVRNIKSGVERTYSIGNGTIFPADFAEDVHRGAFR